MQRGILGIRGCVRRVFCHLFLNPFDVKAGRAKYDAFVTENRASIRVQRRDVGKTFIGFDEAVRFKGFDWANISTY